MKYKIPIIKINTSKSDMRSKMEMWCSRVMCDGIECKDCLFCTDGITPEQEKQFLEWEKQLEAK